MLMYIFLLSKRQVHAESYSDHAAFARTQQNDIQVLQLRSQQFSVTPVQLGW